MKKSQVLACWIVFIAVVIIAVYLLLYTHEKKELTQVCIQENCFDVEIADSEEERRTGLMYREELDTKAGMLFIFERSGKHTFWMKNTYIPLDIIWINQSMHIVDIKENVQPCTFDICLTYGPDQNASYVLEINAGIVSRYRISENQIVSFKK